VLIKGGKKERGDRKRKLPKKGKKKLYFISHTAPRAFINQFGREKGFLNFFLRKKRGGGKGGLLTLDGKRKNECRKLRSFSRYATLRPSCN